VFSSVFLVKKFHVLEQMFFKQHFSWVVEQLQFHATAVKTTEGCPSKNTISIGMYYVL
jgi:hypothetical protein